MFLPQIMSQANPLMQTALAGLSRSQAHKGTAQSPFAASQRLGLQANMGNNALQQAFQQAFGLASQRASMWTGQPSQTQPNLHVQQGLQTGMQQAILAAALQGNAGAQKPTQPQNPWNPGNWGLPPTQGPGWVAF